jgi:hypothetical protein
VKIAYGMGQVSAEQKDRAHALAASGKAGKKEAARIQQRARRARSMRAMGIFEPGAADAMAVAFAGGIDPQRAIAAMRWDVVNPWGAVLEKLSSHPLVARRIQALEESGLPGAPKQWSVLRSLTTVTPEQRAAARARFGRELTIAVAPWAILVPLVVFGAFTGSPFSIGLALALGGALLFVKQTVRYPSGSQAVDEVASLLERLDAGPVGGIPVDVRGQIIGRGFPGYVLSPDLVVQDASGFVPLLYRQPVPFVAALFALFKADKYLGQEVVARGWYRRTPGPVVELREVWASDGTRSRSWEWTARFIASGLVLFAGVVVMLVGLAG